MIRFVLSLLCLMLLWAERPLRAQELDRGGFVTTVGRDTLAVEAFIRYPDRVEGVIWGRTIGRMRYRMAVGPQEIVPDVWLCAWRPGAEPGSAPTQQTAVAVTADVVVLDITSPTGTSRQRIGTRPDALPYLNPSYAQMEQVLRRARALGGDVVEVPLFLLQGGRTVPARVGWDDPSRATIFVDDTEMTVSLADGHLAMGSVARQNLRFRRVDGALPEGAAFLPTDCSLPGEGL